MTALDDEVVRLARRMSVARLGLAQGGPLPLLTALLVPVHESLLEVSRLAELADQPTFPAVDEAIGPATTAVLVDMVSPVAPVTKRCLVCGLLCALADVEDPESYVHVEDREFDDHSAVVDIDSLVIVRAPEDAKPTWQEAGTYIWELDGDLWLIRNGVNPKLLTAEEAAALDHPRRHGAHG